MKRIRGIVLRWILSILLIFGLIYVIDGLNIQLLWFDIISGFKDNKSFVIKAVMLLMVLLIISIVYEFSQIVKYNWRIHVFNKNFTVLIARNAKADLYIGAALCLLNIIIYGILSARGIQPDRSWTDNTYIAHALGEVEGVVYSNCKEALEYSYEIGYKVYEVDLSLTSDGSLACTHDWEAGLQPGFDAENRPSTEEFLNTPIGEGYTPILFADLCEYMLEHPDIWVITDSKGIEPSEIRAEFEQLCREAESVKGQECLDRLIVQIYTDEMYEIVKEIYPFSHYIYTLYMTWDVCADDAEEQLVHFCRFVLKNNLDGITLNCKYNDQDNFMSILRKYQMPYFFHTVNDMEEAQKLLENGAKGIYTDNLLMQMRR